MKNQDIISFNLNRRTNALLKIEYATIQARRSIENANLSQEEVLKELTDCVSQISKIVADATTTKFAIKS